MRNRNRNNITEKVSPENSVTESKNLDNVDTASTNTNNIKLPGIEIGFPTTWSGAWFGMSIVAALLIAFLSMSEEVRERIFKQLVGVEEAQQQSDVNAGSSISSTELKLQHWRKIMPIYKRN